MAIIPTVSSTMPEMPGSPKPGTYISTTSNAYPTISITSAGICDATSAPNSFMRIASRPLLISIVTRNRPSEKPFRPKYTFFRPNRLRAEAN